MAGSDIHLAIVYALYVGAPAIRDELKFRVLLGVVSLGFIVWGLWIGNVITVLFNVLFASTSAWTVRKLIQERRPASLDEDQRLVYDAFFAGLSPAKFLQLWTMGETDLVNGPIIAEGETVHEVLVLLDGEVTAPSLGLTLGRDSPIFLGEMSLVTGNPATTTIVAKDTARVHRWRQEDLRRLESDKPELSHALMGGIARDLVGKVLSDPQ
ncbi:MAG: cyclic nucleotide-binding domain-containing protein [Actinomycetota bacterium]